MERTRTVKRGYVVFGESITLRWGVELSWGNRALGTGKAGCGVRLAAVAAGFAGRAVVFFTAFQKFPHGCADELAVVERDQVITSSNFGFGAFRLKSYCSSSG